MISHFLTFVVYRQTQIFVPLCAVSYEKMYIVVVNGYIKHLFCSASTVYRYLAFAIKKSLLIIGIIRDMV